KAMRPSDRPILLHRGVSFAGIANSTDYDDLKSKEGQTWMSGGFFSTSVGGTPAFSMTPVLLEIEAPPGTPMAWMERQVPDRVRRVGKEWRCRWSPNHKRRIARRGTGRR